MNVERVMSDIEGLADDCKLEIHRFLPMDQAQKIKVAVAFETLLDQIEDTIRHACPGSP